jgi:hypothetical protein
LFRLLFSPILAILDLEVIMNTSIAITRLLFLSILLSALACAPGAPGAAGDVPQPALLPLYLPMTARYTTHFSFRDVLFGPGAASFSTESRDPQTGAVQLNGYAGDGAIGPFTWDWGDGSVDQQWLPATHTYADPGRDYLVMATVAFANGQQQQVPVAIRFLPLQPPVVSLPPDLAVSIPAQPTPLQTRLYTPPGGLTYFDDSWFTTHSRPAVEAILSIAAMLQVEFANGDVFRPDQKFQQVVVRDAAAGGMYSLWFTSPVSFAAGNYAFQGTPQYSSFFHEMGHNVTLNFPAGYYFGGKIDGDANAIYSETMANIFAHATAYELLNNASAYGVDALLAAEIANSAQSSMLITQAAYERYLNEGMHFHSWNDPLTPTDETFDTFMTLARQFCAHAELGEQGYKAPLQRMMRLLAGFNAGWRERYNQSVNTPQAEAFRATLMVAALSYAFDEDLRLEFRALNFPLDDGVYAELMAGVP